MTLTLNKSSSGRDVMKFVLSTLHEAIETERTLHTENQLEVDGAMQHLYNSVKAVGIMYGITEKELKEE